jgi:DNA polymerase
MNEPSLSSFEQELAELTASARAWVEWHEATGSTGLVVKGKLAVEGKAERPEPNAEPPPQRAPAARKVGPAAPPAHAAAAPSALGSPGRPAAAASLPHRPASPPAEPPLPLEERRVRLATIAETVRSCVKCGLHATRTNTVFARGNPMAELCFVGEGPGADEDAQGEPFVGRAGQLLDKMIVAMGYLRDDVYICNIVKCRPPENRKPELSEMDACSPYLTEQLKLISPRVIVALGATAVQGLIGTSEGITRMRGKWKLYKGTIPIMPTFHPAYLLRQPAAKRDVWNDLQEVMRHLGKPVPAPTG